VLQNVTDVTQATSAFNSGTWALDSSLELMNSAAGVPVDGLHSRFKYNPATEGCL
jgi:hypothetical protein